MLAWIKVPILIILIGACQEGDSFTATEFRCSRNASVFTRRAKKIRLCETAGNDVGSGCHNQQVQGVTLKIAIDQQGGVADLSSEKSERFTCGASLDMVHRLRRCSDAVLVGKTTVVNDDCSLTVRRVPLEIVNNKRGSQPRQQPIRVIVDPRKTLNLSNYTIARDGLPTIIVHINPTCIRYKSDEFPNVEYLGIPPQIESDSEKKQSPRLSSQEISEKLRSLFGIRHLMVEGGPATANSFLREGMVDRAIIVRAPILFHEPLLWEPWSKSLASSPLEAAGLVRVGAKMSGVDTIEYWSRPGKGWPSDPEPLSSWP